MIRKAKRYFNTSGPNRPHEHYTLTRDDLIAQGVELVKKERYFTIWAPRQTGKSTYFRFLANHLNNKGYRTTHINLENYRDASIEDLFSYLFHRIQEGWNIQLKSENFSALQTEIEKTKDGPSAVLIIDEIEGLNPELFNQFLHTIRNIYHSRSRHILKSIILVGVANIVGIIQDNASPFNIADNLAIPYFTKNETYELLNMHEKETGQLLDEKVKAKLSDITANQPGLINAFAYQITKRFPEKEKIDYTDYLRVERWFLKEAIDKNIANVVNKAKQYRSFVENLLFTQRKVEFDIERPAIKFLYTQGIIRADEEGYIQFWVPAYRKKLFSAFYPYLNGEANNLMREINLGHFFMEEGKLNFDRLMEGYRKYIKRRGFRYFREKKSDGSWKHIKEAAMAYSFESYIQLLLQTIEGKSYFEPHAGLGNCDLILNIEGTETVVEFKIYRDLGRYEKGKKQLAHYCKSVSVHEGVYVVFVPDYYKELNLEEKVETIEQIKIISYLVYYDEEKDF